MPNNIYKSAVVGLGVGEQHAITLQAQNNVELSYLLDIDQDKTQDVLTRLGQKNCVIAESYDEIIDSNVDIISIASFDQCHANEVIQGLNVRKHIFVEKPLCQTYEELKCIKDSYRRNSNSVIMSNLVLRAAPLYVWLKQAIEQDVFGELYLIEGEYLYGRLHKIASGWRSETPNYSVMAGGGIHLADLVLTLLGKKPHVVHTVGNKIVTSGMGFSYPDYLSATFNYDNGLIAKISANFGCVHRHHHVLRIYGTKATFIYDDAGARIHYTRDESIEASRVRYSPFPLNGKGSLIPSFIDLISQGSEQKNQQAQHEFDLMSMILTSDKAFKSGNKEEVIYV